MNLLIHSTVLYVASRSSTLPTSAHVCVQVQDEASVVSPKVIRVVDRVVDGGPPGQQ